MQNQCWGVAYVIVYGHISFLCSQFYLPSGKSTHRNHPLPPPRILPPNLETGHNSWGYPEKVPQLEHYLLILRGFYIHIDSG